MWAIKRNTLVCIIACALGAHAQQPKPLMIGLDKAVGNEDGGQAFIIEQSSRRWSQFRQSRRDALSAPEQYSIFVGSQWQTNLRNRQSTLRTLLANVTAPDELAALEAMGIHNRFAPAFSAERSDLTAGSLSDLDVQRLLATMLDSGALSTPTPMTVYVVFLDSEFASTLGPLSAGKHYVAYHNTFRTGGSTTRYVVIPFQSDSVAAYQTAVRGFIAAATKADRLPK